MLYLKITAFSLATPRTPYHVPRTILFILLNFEYNQPSLHPELLNP